MIIRPIPEPERTSLDVLLQTEGFTPLFLEFTSTSDESNLALDIEELGDLEVGIVVARGLSLLGRHLG